eukprot:TRINITY_DN28700_c0_g1_i1.p1 TRINITY_DN28700_c0_g1~~TRINITY_DN28700_c0_g1_i1.p1  ORF type:complete len:339 (-),score=102.05 TRINITY_DN28700_c0_g1_i1:15-1031(-)
MCILLFCLRDGQSTDDSPLKLVLIGNRDEYLERSTTPAHFWRDHEQLLAGRDGERGGTWLGVTKSGRVAALTNFRAPADAFKEHARSRGRLLSSFLTSDRPPLDYLHRVEAEARHYNDFNLLVTDGGPLCYYGSQHAAGPTVLENNKVYGLCNAVIDTPWPKVERGKAMFATELDDWHRGLKSTKPTPTPTDSDLDALTERLFAVLSDQTRARPEELPDTGVGVEWETILSSIFVSHVNKSLGSKPVAPEGSSESPMEGSDAQAWEPQSPHYGTRSQAVLLVDFDGRVVFTERTFAAPSLVDAPSAPFKGEAQVSIVNNELGTWRQTRFEFRVDANAC